MVDVEEEEYELQDVGIIYDEDVEKKMDTEQFQAEEITEAYKDYARHRQSRLLQRDLVVYLLWITLYLTLIFMIRDIKATHRLESALREYLVYEEYDFDRSHVLKEFDDITQEEEFWGWVHGPLIQAITEIDDDDGNVWLLRSNRLLGSARLRQLRVRGDTCTITKSMRDFIPDCYGPYSSSNKDTEPYGPGNIWTYSETNAPTQYGLEFDAYDGGGYVIELSHDPNVTQSQVDFLEENDWLDRQTRAVVITVNVYNADVNSFLSMNFLIEFLPGGGILNTWNYRSFKADLYLNPVDYFRLFLEIVFIIVLSGWTAYTAKQIIWYKKKGGHFLVWFVSPGWNLIQVVNLAIFWATAGVYLNFVARLSGFRNSIDTLDEGADFVEMENLGLQWVMIFNVTSVNVLLCILTLFKYLNANDRMALMWRALQHAGPNVLTFLIFFFIIFLGFVASGHLLFGPELDEFKNLLNSLFSCFKIILGDNEYDKLEQANRVLAPMYFILFIVLVFFILLNMFLAILNSAYDELQEEWSEATTIGKMVRGFIVQQRHRVQEWYERKKRERQGGETIKKPTSSSAVSRSFREFAREVDKEDEEETQPKKSYTISTIQQQLGLGEDEVQEIGKHLLRAKQKRMDRQERQQEEGVTREEFLELFRMVRELNFKIDKLNGN